MTRRHLLVERLEPRLAPAALPTGFTETTLASGLTSATAMEIAPDGKLFVAEQGGTLEVWNDGVRLASNFFRDAPLTTQSGSERGLLGIAFDPDYQTNRFVYVYYTTAASDNHNRVSRFTASETGDLAIAGSEVTVLDLDPHAVGNHNGGALHFGPDGKLYIAVGDNANQNNPTSVHNSQRLGTLHGKMLRINADGTIPDDNPFYSQTTGNNRAIWSLGLRNPFTFSFDRDPGGAQRMFINDVGQTDWEEINLGAAGANFGWPTTEGDFNAERFPQFTRPLFAYHHDSQVSTPSGCAITGGAFYRPLENRFGADYEGDYFFSDYCGGWIYRLDAATGTVAPFAANISEPVDLKVADEGRLFYLSRGSGEVRAIDFTGQTTPVVNDHPDDLTVAAGQRASFSVSASGGGLRYQWRRAEAATPDEFTDIPGATSAVFSIASPSADDNGDRFLVRIANSLGEVESRAALLTVLANQPPAPTIVAPRSRFTWRAGEEIQISGFAVDEEDGALESSSLRWEVRFYHNDGRLHYHPFATFVGVDNASFVIPDSGETSPNVWFRILLTAVDSSGLSTTVKRDILPRLATVELASLPAGAPLLLDGAPAPASFRAVVGMKRTIAAPFSFSVEGAAYEFVSWSDGQPAAHELITPAVDAVLTASYGRAPPSGLVAEYFDLSADQVGLPDLSARTPDVARVEKRLLYRATSEAWPGLDDRFADHFAARYTGFLKVATAGAYTLHLGSDDGSRLWIDGQLLIDNDGVHRMRERSATIELEVGHHELRIEYFENTGLAGLVLAWEGPGIARQVIPATNLSRSRPVAVSGG